ncbi:MAG: tol-pal system protein YbgF [Proteobacteria bacterium]|nr:tol-pal system protein YbgF [Pseudomonadota bacterium]
MSSSSTSTNLRCLAAATAALLLTACASQPTGPDPVQQRFSELEERVARVDRIVDNQSLVQLEQRIELQQAQLRELNGRIDELQNANEQLKRQQRDLYADLDQRIKAAPAPTAQQEPASLVATPVVAQATGDEQQQYTRAFDLLKNGDYAAAVSAFKQQAVSFPTGALADNTQYWLGEAYYVMRDYPAAAAAFEKVIAGWPSSRKLADAQLKLGFTQFEQKRLAQARATLQQVVTRFPGTDAAKLAAERLSKIPADAR